MTDKLAYVRGFKDSARRAGVTPLLLAKTAQYLPRPSGKKSVGYKMPTILDRLYAGYNSLSPETRHGLIGGLVGGLGTLAFSSGDFTDRLLKAIALGGLSGLGTYAVDKSGIIDKGLDLVNNPVRFGINR